MRILLFTEILDCGGIDTFIINLINNWPDKADSFVIIANSSYPGLRVIEENLKRPCEVIRHKVLLYVDLLRQSSLPGPIKKVLSLVLRYGFMGYNILAFKRLLLQTNSDALLVINGGYPGGDSCRAAGISWGVFSGKPHSIHCFHSMAMRAPWQRRLQEYLVDSVLCAFTSRFLTVSRAAADSMVSRPKIYKKGITGYIYNGIGSAPSGAVPVRDIRAEIGVSSSARLCLMLATYDPLKGHYFLFQAFKKVVAEIPDAHLLICGFGLPADIQRVRQYVADFQLDKNVHLMGFRTDLPNLFSNTDVLLVASQTQESFGYSSIEAMAHLVPVVATSVGGIPEVVLNDDGGYCVPLGDIETYARKIVELLLDNKLREVQGRKGFDRVQRLFTAEVMADKYYKIIKQLHARV